MICLLKFTLGDRESHDCVLNSSLANVLIVGSIAFWRYTVYTWFRQVHCQVLSRRGPEFKIEYYFLRSQCKRSVLQRGSCDPGKASLREHCVPWNEQICVIVIALALVRSRWREKREKKWLKKSEDRPSAERKRVAKTIMLLISLFPIRFGGFARFPPISSRRRTLTKDYFSRPRDEDTDNFAVGSSTVEQPNTDRSSVSREHFFLTFKKILISHTDRDVCATSGNWQVIGSLTRSRSYLRPFLGHHESLLLRIISTLGINETVLRIAILGIASVLSAASVLLIQLVAKLLVIGVRRMSSDYSNVRRRQCVSGVMPRGIHRRVQPWKSWKENTLCQDRGFSMRQKRFDAIRIK